MNESMMYLGIGLIAVGFLLIVVEAFVPSGGIIGVVAVLCAVAGIVALFRYETAWGVSGMLTTVVLGPMVFFFAISMLPSTPFGRRLIGEPSEAELAERNANEQAIRDKYKALIGLEGVAVTDLRPVGEARFGRERHEVLAEGGLIEAGTRVHVTRAEPNLIKVRAVRDPKVS